MRLEYEESSDRPTSRMTHRCRQNLMLEIVWKKFFLNSDSDFIDTQLTERCATVFTHLKWLENASRPFQLFTAHRLGPKL